MTEEKASKFNICQIHEVSLHFVLGVPYPLVTDVNHLLMI